MKKLLMTLLVLSLAFGGAGMALADDYMPEESISFAMSGAYPPFNFVNVMGELEGFDVDIAREIASRLDLEAELIATPWDTIIGALQANRFDAILGSMAVTPARLEQVNFSDPYYISGAQLLVNTDSDIHTPDDLDDAVLAVVVGTTFEEEANNMPGVSEVRLYEAEEMTLQDLQIGRVDGVITDRLIGLYMTEEMGLDFRLAGDLLYEETIAVAIHKDHTQLLEAINGALAEMREDGTYLEISEKWFGRDISQ